MTEQTCAACDNHTLDRESQEYVCRLECDAYPNGGQAKCGPHYCERAWKFPVVAVQDRQMVA